MFFFWTQCISISVSCYSSVQTTEAIKKINIIHTVDYNIYTSVEKTASVAQLGLSIPGLWAVLQNDAKWYYKRKMGSKSGTNVDFLLTVLETEHTDKSPDSLFLHNLTSVMIDMWSRTSEMDSTISAKF